MTTNEKTADVLNDLVRINNDRVVGYEKAAQETADIDADLRVLFQGMAADSRTYALELSKYVYAKGDEPANDSTLQGKIYRAWMDVKAAFSGKNRKAILASCERGEDAAQHAYDTALASDAEMEAEIRQLIMTQKTELKKSHDKIKAMRDIQVA